MELGKLPLPCAEVTQELSSLEAVAASKFWCLFLLGIQCRNSTVAVGLDQHPKTQTPPSPQVQGQKQLILTYQVPKTQEDKQDFKKTQEELIKDLLSFASLLPPASYYISSQLHSEKGLSNSVLFINLTKTLGLECFLNNILINFFIACECPALGDTRA